jgi:hypothetical protein
MINILMYYSTYLILFGFLYYFKFIPINPYIWLIIASFLSLIILSYLIIHNANMSQIFIYILLNSPKIVLLLLLDNKNLLKGFIFYSLLFCIYLIYFNDLYDIYYNKTIIKLLNDDYI